MWLLNCEGKGLRLEEFHSRLPAYAILSHTWEDGEVSFKDMRKGRALDKAGFPKIEFCVNQARRDGFKYCWIDTCCIDKANNTEVSEAINSMFRWYQDAEICYVYLSDVPQKRFGSSRWFTRGWTLQELLAPRLIEFFTSSGKKIGTKASLIEEIQRTTKIPLGALRGQDLADFSFEEKMSWTVGRETKRPEDIAYCLLGIFDTPMPLIYGERREKALARLRKTINENCSYHESETVPMRHTSPIQNSRARQESLPPRYGQTNAERALDSPPRTWSRAVVPAHILSHDTRSVTMRIASNPLKKQAQSGRIVTKQLDTTNDWEPAFQCESCEKCFQNQSATDQHMDATGHRAPKTECESCEKRFQNQAAADQHMDATGHRAPKIECESCEKRFQNQAAADQHMDATGHRAPKIECESCEKRFQNQASADQHMDATGHRAPKIKCESCDKRFQSPAAAKQHMDATCHWR